MTSEMMEDLDGMSAGGDTATTYSLASSLRTTRAGGELRKPAGDSYTGGFEMDSEGGKSGGVGKRSYGGWDDCGAMRYAQGTYTAPRYV